MLLEREYPARADELQRAFVDPERLAQWFRPAPGLAAARVRADGERAVELAFATPAGDVQLAFVWRERAPGCSLAFDLERRDARGAHRSTVQISLVGLPGGGTRLSLRHDGFGSDAGAEAEAKAGWRHALGRLIGACPDALDAYYARIARRREPTVQYRSRHGGLWPDRVDAEAVLADKRARGVLDDADVARFRHFAERGFVLLPGAVPAATIAAFRDEVARDWERGNPAVTIELCDGEGGYHAMHPSLRERPHKVLDYHCASANARAIQFAPAIHGFLTRLFERAPMATQSLLFKYGTEQAMHQDTAYVVMRSPLEFVGCWVALEDVVPGSGELQYYVGSHRIPEFEWFGRARARPEGYDDDAEFLAWVDDQSRRAGCELVRFLPKQGDALVWHADLVHGGSPRVDRERTRWSLVTHYCPVDVDPGWMTDPERHLRRQHANDAFYCGLSQQ